AEYRLPLDDVRRLQWGRCANAAETLQRATHTEVQLALQWGRCANAAETSELDRAVARAAVASMGPLRERSGDEQFFGGVPVLLPASMGPLRERSGAISVPASMCALSRCFNGAAARTQRRPASSRLCQRAVSEALQWGRCANAAETCAVAW